MRSFLPPSPAAASVTFLPWILLCAPVIPVFPRPPVPAPARPVLFQWAPICASDIAIPFRHPTSSSVTVARMALVPRLGIGVSTFAGVALLFHQGFCSAPGDGSDGRVTPHAFRSPVPKYLRS